MNPINHNKTTKMKLTKLLTACVLVAAIAMISCKGKGPKDLIVNKWQMSEIGGAGAAQIPDSVKTKVIGHATIEFKKEGNFESSDMGDGPKTGTYAVSADGKILSTTDSGKSYTDSLDIIEISASKVILLDKRSDIKMTMTAK